MTLGRGYKAVGFDMDGTLLDTSIDYAKLGHSEMDVFIRLGIPESEIDQTADEKSMILQAAAYLEKAGRPIPYDELCAMANQRAGEIEMEAADTAECFPGTVNLLRRLKASGTPVGLLTRGQRIYAETAMGRCGIIGYMDAIEAFNDHPMGEQKPNPVAMEYLAKRLGVKCSELLYVGDNLWDYKCARDAGSDFVGIASTKFGRDRWKSIGEDITVVSSIAELEDILWPE